MEKCYMYKYDLNCDKLKEHEKEYENLDFESYCRGWDDGCDGATTSAAYNMATIICERWDDFMEALHYCEQNSSTDLGFHEGMFHWLVEEFETR